MPKYKIELEQDDWYSIIALISINQKDLPQLNSIKVSLKAQLIAQILING